MQRSFIPAHVLDTMQVPAQASTPSQDFPSFHGYREEYAAARASTHCYFRSKSFIFIPHCTRTRKQKLYTDRSIFSYPRAEL